VSQPRYQSPEVEETRERLADDLVDTRALVIVIPFDSNSAASARIYSEGSSIEIADAIARMLFVTDEFFGESTAMLARAMDRPLLDTRVAIEELAANHRSLHRAARRS
jgi:hypothetical protein